MKRFLLTCLTAGLFLQPVMSAQAYYWDYGPGVVNQPQKEQTAVTESQQPAIDSPSSRKSDAAILADYAALPGGPADDEWGNYFPQGSYATAPIGNKPESFLRQYNAYSKVDTNEKVLYLTFDEGYENGYTPAILDTLKKHNVKVTFFVTMPYLTGSLDLVQRMVAEGHIVGNHTRSHMQLVNVSDKNVFYEQLKSVEDKYQELIGSPMQRFYRPPQGAYSAAQLQLAQAMDYKTILWSVAYMDWDPAKQPSHESALNTLHRRIHPGAIILLHAESRTNTEILDGLLTEYENAGYRFATLNELP